MDPRRRTWFDERGLARADAEASLPVYAGAMHYWRVPPAQWDAGLRALHGLGFTCVETYVPWRVHAPTATSFDWRGGRELGRFIDAAGARGLSVILRPGPHVNAELTSFGMPDWVLGEAACQAQTARGTPAWLPSPPRAWPIPSYASTAFQARVRAWYAAVAEVVRPRLAPEGPVVALGVDNEAQLFFRLGAYDLDYHPDALAWWAEEGQGEAPRAWDASRPAACAAWVRWKDRYVARGLGVFAGFLDEVGLGGVARFHNLPPGPHGLYDLRGIQAAIGGPVGIDSGGSSRAGSGADGRGGSHDSGGSSRAGSGADGRGGSHDSGGLSRAGSGADGRGGSIDAYTPRADFPALRRRALACVGSARPIPIGFEVGVGWMPWLPPLDSGDDVTRERDQLLVLLAAGLRGFNVYMAVERDRYAGAAIALDGRVEPHATWLRPLLAALAEVDWPALRRAAVIALVACKADARFGLASSLLDPMTPVVAELLGLGPGGSAELGRDPAAIAARRWQDAVARALELAQVPYVIVDEGTPDAELARYRAVIVPTPGGRVDRALWGRLRALAEAKTTRIVIGPIAPTRDELDEPLADATPARGLGKLAAASLTDLPGLADDLAALAGEPTDSWQVERPDDVRCFVHADAAGAARVLFVINDGDKACSAVLLADDHVLRDVFSDEVLRISAGRVGMALPARGVRMFIVER